MAINRLDYKYVHNTLPTSKEDISDRNLKVGSKVENLLPVLSDDTVYVPYMEYYANRDKSKCWYVEVPNGKQEGKFEKVYKTDKVAKISEEWGVRSFSTALELEEYYTKWYEWPMYTTNTFYYTLRTDLGTFERFSSWDDIDYTKEGDQYEIEVTREGIAKKRNEDYELYYGSSYVDAHYYTQESWVSVLSSETSENGTLRFDVRLEKNKQYVVQIVNAYKITNGNTITTPNGNEISFDSYLCFNAPEDGEYIFKINGLSFGCRVYGVEQNKVIELRDYQAPSTAQVYLFESDKPWMVDIDGTITGVGESATTTSASAITIEATLDNDKIKNMFSAAPSLTINSGGNLVVSVEGIDTTLWNGLSSKPEIYLLTYRDYLTNESRVYNGIKTKNRRGLIRSIQKTSIPYRLKENKLDPNEKEKINYQLLPIEVSNTLNYTFVANTSVDRTEAKPIAFDIIPLLGYNYSYCGENLHYADENRFKYTSICFAWGIKNSNNKFEAISGFSIPVIVERNIVNGQFTTEKNTDYYSEDSIYYIKSK